MGSIEPFHPLAASRLTASRRAVPLRSTTPLRGVVTHDVPELALGSGRRLVRHRPTLKRFYERVFSPIDWRNIAIEDPTLCSWSARIECCDSGPDTR